MGRRAERERETSAPKVHRLEIQTGWKVLDLLDRLVATGLYGPTREAAAEELLRAELRRRFPPPVPPEEPR